MDEINNNEIAIESTKRKSSGWEIRMPMLQILLIVLMVGYMMGQGDSYSPFFKQTVQTIFFADICSPIFSLFLLLKSKTAKKSYGVAAFVISLIVPIILIYIGLTYGAF